MRILWTRPARRDMRGILSYIGERNPNATAQVEEHIVKSVEKLADFPYLGRPGRRAGTRELVITRFPYIVIYGVQEQEVVIYRVLHGAQNLPQDLNGH